MKLTHSQSAQLHILVSGVLSLLSAVATATYQTATSNHLNAGQIAAFAIGTFTVSVGASFLSVMHAMQTSPDATQASADTATLIESKFSALESKVLSWTKSTGAPAPQSIAPPQASAPVEQVTTGA